MHSPKTYFVYIITNRSKTLYTGVTNNLIRRVRKHKSGTCSGFAAKYKLDCLVYFERFEISAMRLSVKSESKAGCASRRLP